MYSYYENVRDSVIDFLIEEEIELTRDNCEEIYDRLFCEDKITGNVSGSYTFSSAAARQYLSSNTSLILEMTDEFGYSASEIGYKYLVEPEIVDVMLRCYVLGRVVDELVNENEESRAMRKQLTNNSPLVGKEVG